MGKILVSYFSASGKTKRVAEKIAEVLKGDLFEIQPEERYTAEDLDWTNEESRSSVEMKNRDFRPQVKERVGNIDEYNTVVLGFPVWWYTAPTIVNTFIEENDLGGKKIYVFVTSGSSSHAGSLKDLKEKYSHLNFINGKRFDGRETAGDIISFIS